MADNPLLKIAALAVALGLSIGLSGAVLLTSCGSVGWAVRKDGFTLADDNWGVRVYIDGDRVQSIYFEAEDAPDDWTITKGTTPEGWPYILMERVEQ